MGVSTLSTEVGPPLWKAKSRAGLLGSWAWPYSPVTLVGLGLFLCAWEWYTLPPGTARGHRERVVRSARLCSPKGQSRMCQKIPPRDPDIRPHPQIVRQNRGRKACDRPVAKTKKKKKAEGTVFTEEDFQKFQQEYFGS